MISLNLSKKALRRLRTVSFLVALSLLKRDIGGRMDATSVPFSRIEPSRKDASMNLRVSSGLSLSSVMIFSSSCSFWRSTYSLQTTSTSVTSGVRESMKFSMRSFLLRSSMLESMALVIERRISAFPVCSFWYLVTSNMM